MTSGAFRFDRFVLDPVDRRLLGDGSPIELNTRYLDALVLLVGERGRLVSKTRFHDEVWRGVPVTDEALTQCIKTLRSRLGDDATNPRFIETVPKHGYRFIASVTREGDGVAPPTPLPTPPPTGQQPAAFWPTCLRLAGASMLGGGFAGILGGLFYGFVGISDPLQPGGGAVSALLVMICLTMLVGVIGGGGVGFGIAAAVFASGRRGAWRIVGGAAGGLVVGAVVKLVGLDAFSLLLGQSPGDITGAQEGAVLGGAVGIGAWLASRPALSASLPRAVVVAGLIAAAAGAAIPALGGRLMGGSLDLLADRFPGSRLRLDHLGALFGEPDFGLISQIATGAVEGLLFGGCVVAAMMIARVPSHSPDDASLARG